ncbi:MAG TPA: hypothetical protein PK308_00085 [Phycisphaerales bacterium]|nr:hypothetical protein [Phycisphaerales bacterium]
MKVKFTKETHGERYFYAAGHEVEVVPEGHGHGHIPQAWADELVASGAAVVTETDAPQEAPAETQGGGGHGEG